MRLGVVVSPGLGVRPRVAVRPQIAVSPGLGVPLRVAVRPQIAVGPRFGDRPRAAVSTLVGRPRDAENPGRGVHGDPVTAGDAVSPGSR